MDLRPEEKGGTAKGLGGGEQKQEEFLSIAAMRYTRTLFLLLFGVSQLGAFQPQFSVLNVKQPLRLRSARHTCGLHMHHPSRRETLANAARVLLAGATGILGAMIVPKRSHAAAGGDIFKAPLHNRYFLVRAGKIVWEDEDLDCLTTNPVHKLHVDRCGLSSDGLSDARKAADSRERDR